MTHRHLPLLATALLLGVAAWAQGALPEGLQRQGDVITMQPIQDSDLPEDVQSGEAADHRAGTVRALSATDHETYARAFGAADRGDWPAARGLAATGRNETARRLVQWRYLLDKNSGAPFAEIDAFLKANPDWPLRGALLARAEATLDPATPPEAVITWFAGRNPVSPIGKIRLGDALIAAGKVAAGRDLVQQGWMEGSFEPDQELAIVQKNGAYLTPDIDKRRLDNLLWRDEVTGARRELARVDDTTQRLGTARIALRTNPAAAQSAIAALAAELGSDPELLFDRARATRRSGDNSGALALIRQAPIKKLARRHPSQLWAELNIEARQALQDNNPGAAYELLSDTGLAASDEFAEAEFMAGWIALRFLKDPAAAALHFRRLADGVSRPISLARGHYWLGRACEEQGDAASAWQQYRAATKAPATFYGQLAMARLSARPILRLRDAAASAPSRAAFEREDTVRAMRVLADLGAQNLLRHFALRYQELHPGAGHAKRLAQALVEMGFREIAVRVAKVAGYDGAMLMTYAYPTIAIPSYRGPGAAPEKALVLGIIRQETEFDPEAVSRAGARGIMQLMPSTARRNARLAGLPYRRNKLIDDSNYNMQLGMTEITGYYGDWNNVVLAAAAYNAGPNNVKKWMAAFGDPRDSKVDPIDWIEQIPFNETRNYVQRVIENLQVYRNRLAGRDHPLRILADLYGPNPPPTKVLNYTPPPPAPVPVPAPKPGEKVSSKN